MKKTDRFVGLIAGAANHKEGLNCELFHHEQRLFGEFSRIDRLRISRKDILRRIFQRVMRLLKAATKIAVGDHANQILFVVDDAGDAANFFARH